MIDLFNKNFDKGLTVFQLFLMGFMIYGAILNRQDIVLFSTFNCIIGYFEPTGERF